MLIHSFAHPSIDPSIEARWLIDSLIDFALATSIDPSD
jgi:hypothetical protein